MTLQNIREEFDKFWEIEKHNNGALAPRQSDRIADFFLPRFQAHLESLAKEIEGKKKEINQPGYPRKWNSAITLSAEIICNSLKI